MKIEIVIETLLVLLDSLDGDIGGMPDYKGLPAKLVRYKQELVYSIIRRIRSREYPITYVLGFPSTRVLPISDKEKEFLFNQYQSLDNYYYEIANRICDFYEKFLIIYGKSKHGLIIIPGLIVPETEPTFKNSSLACLDKKTKSERKGSFFESDLNSDNFNTFAYLNFNDSLLKEIENIIFDLKKFISNICDLNRKKIINCGESYFLFQLTDENHLLWWWPTSLSEKDRAIVDAIANKILPWYYMPKVETFTFSFLAYNEDIGHSLLTNPVTIVHDPDERFFPKDD